MLFFRSRNIRNGVLILFVLLTPILLFRFAPHILPHSVLHEFNIPQSTKSWHNTAYSIIDGVLGASVFAFIVFLFRHTFIDMLTNTSRIQVFNNYDELANVFKRHFSNYQNGISPNKLHLTILTPFLFNNESIKILSKTTAESHGSISIFSEILNEMVHSKTDSYERVLVGKTSNKELNKINSDHIQSLYFNGDGLPPTTGIGYHNNLNETANIILCKQDTRNPSKPDIKLFMVTIIFSGEYTSISGYSTTDEWLIQEALNFYEVRFEEAKKCNQYFENTSEEEFWPSPIVQYDAFKNHFMEFYSVIGPGYQFSPPQENASHTP